MNSDESLPPPSPSSQPENAAPASSGHAWNNGLTRRSFLKRTGGATVATLATWHGLSSRVMADQPPRAGVPLKAVLELLEHQEVWMSEDPPDSADYSDFTTMSSGEELSGWVASFDGPITGSFNPWEVTAHGPGPVTWTRTKQ